MLNMPICMFVHVLLLYGIYDVMGNCFGFRNCGLATKCVITHFHPIFPSPGLKVLGPIKLRKVACCHDVLPLKNSMKSNMYLSV